MTAYILLLVAVLACALSYVAPFWILFPSSWGGIGGSITGWSASGFSFYKSSAGDIFRRFWVAGLWAACTGRDNDVECGWFWKNEFYAEKNLPG